MAIPVYLWLYDEEDDLVRGDVDINRREGSIEIVGIQHDVFLPTDDLTGQRPQCASMRHIHSKKKLTALRLCHYRSRTMVRSLTKAIFRYYHINYNGMEEEYFNIILENVKICHVVPIMFDIKDPDFKKHRHIEHVGLRYEKITWNYVDGNNPAH
ncbi:type VI secretion system tube protein TssD [Candidatus Pantoea persica]|uniref:type VI secretion system tube protein TssD n=1 Tax=Candidatus Pantoea persica TaxID=2518128 RepID=UPI00215D9BE0|nr:type VI secretion system tube protein TssD [Candidatus Pantoea persica]MBA2815882.1 Secreted protein hcp [Candidatus Pantoea persica]